MLEKPTKTSIRIDRFSAANFNPKDWDTLKRIEEYARQSLTGRKDWDQPHTELVVFYTLYLAKAVQLDLLVMAGAAWMHDTGYQGLFEEVSSDSRENVRDKKALHMIKGAEKTMKLFQNPEMQGRLSLARVRRMAHLVGVHDNVEKLRDLDEIVLMEADTLGMINVSKLTPTYGKQDMLNHIASVERRRIPKFRTTLGVQFLNELMPKYREYASNQ
jgi:hypothetical protein